MLRLMLSRRWWWTTLLVLAASSIMVRLGIWQLDRLAQRRVFNAHVLEQQAATVLDLSTVTEFKNLIDMEFRLGEAIGVYDFKFQVALRNQYWNNQYGYALLTPLILENGRAVMVERGWIPGECDSRESWQQFNEIGTVTVIGIIRIPHSEPEMGGIPDPDLASGQDSLDFWNNVNLDRIQEQIPYPLMPVYIQRSPNENRTELPHPLEPDVVVSEGNHLGYAVQWFTYASILFFGYPFWLKQQVK